MYDEADCGLKTKVIFNPYKKKYSGKTHDDKYAKNLCDQQEQKQLTNLRIGTRLVGVLNSQDSAPTTGWQ